MMTIMMMWFGSVEGVDGRIVHAQRERGALGFTRLDRG